MAWTKTYQTEEERLDAERRERERRNMQSTYGCGYRTGGRSKKLRPSPCTTVVMPGYDPVEAIQGNGCGET
jgi:hypothetical protein